MSNKKYGYRSIPSRHATPQESEMYRLRTKKAVRTRAINEWKALMEKLTPAEKNVIRKAITTGHSPLILSSKYAECWRATRL